MPENSDSSRATQPGPAIRRCLQQLVVLTQAADRQSFNPDLQVVIRAIGVVAEQLLNVIEPIFDNEPAAEQHVLPVETPEHGILVVTPQQENLTAAEALLKSWGFFVVGMRTFEAAHAAVETRPFDAILIDFDYKGTCVRIKGT